MQICYEGACNLFVGILEQARHDYINMMLGRGTGTKQECNMTELMKFIDEDPYSLGYNKKELLECWDESVRIEKLYSDTRKSLTKAQKSRIQRLNEDILLVYEKEKFDMHKYKTSEDLLKAVRDVFKKHARKKKEAEA